MIEYQILRQLVFEFLRTNTEPPHLQFNIILEGVVKLAADKNVFPTQEECREKQIKYLEYYAQKRLNPQDTLLVNQIVWDLIVERILTIGTDTSNPE